MTKRKLIIALTIFSVAVFGYNYWKESLFSDSLFECNVEALSRTEPGIYIHCYKTIVSDPTDQVTYCGTCSTIPGRWKSGMDFCTNQ